MIYDRVTPNVLHGIIFLDLESAFANYHPDLAFIVDGFS
jgi:hypothetical protein